MNEEIDGQLLIEELKGQRNAVSDQLAFAGVLIVSLRAKIKELEQAQPTAPPPA